jgi:hypothetical protein
VLAFVVFGNPGGFLCLCGNICVLLLSIAEACSTLFFQIVSKQQVAHGMKRLCNISDDLSLDTPNAKIIINDFIERLHNEGILENREGLML